MIHYIKGRITETGQGLVIIENNGIGYEVNVPLGDKAYLAGDEEVTLYTFMQVKEDGITLFGFSDRMALTMFGILVTVSGVGGKGAMAILSALTPSELQKAVISGNSKAIQSANGIGKKIADRIVLELKDKMEKLGFVAASDMAAPVMQAPIIGERAKAVNMLVATGANKTDAERAVASIEDDSLKAGQYFMIAAKMFK